MDNLPLYIAEFIVVVTIVIAYRYLIPWIKTKFAMTWAKEAVQAAEQIYGDAQGKVKKEEVVKFLADILKSHHINFSEAEIDYLIEAAVKKLKLEMQQATSN